MNSGPVDAFVYRVDLYRFDAPGEGTVVESFPVNRRVPVGGELSVSVPVETVEAALFGSGEPLRFTFVTDRGAGTVAVPPPRMELYIHVTLPTWLDVSDVINDEQWVTRDRRGNIVDAEPEVVVACVAGNEVRFRAVEGPTDQYNAQFVELVPSDSPRQRVWKVDAYGFGECRVRFVYRETQIRAAGGEWQAPELGGDSPLVVAFMPLMQDDSVEQVVPLVPGGRVSLNFTVPEIVTKQEFTEDSRVYTATIDFSWYFAHGPGGGDYNNPVSESVKYAWTPLEVSESLQAAGVLRPLVYKEGVKAYPVPGLEEPPEIAEEINEWGVVWWREGGAANYSLQPGAILLFDGGGTQVNPGEELVGFQVPVYLDRGVYIMVPVFGYQEYSTGGRGSVDNNVWLTGSITLINGNGTVATISMYNDTLNQWLVISEPTGDGIFEANILPDDDADGKAAAQVAPVLRVSVPESGWYYLTVKFRAAGTETQTLNRMIVSVSKIVLIRSPPDTLVKTLEADFLPFIRLSLDYGFMSYRQSLQTLPIPPEPVTYNYTLYQFGPGGELLSRPEFMLKVTADETRTIADMNDPGTVLYTHGAPGVGGGTAYITFLAELDAQDLASIQDATVRAAIGDPTVAPPPAFIEPPEPGYWLQLAGELNTDGVSEVNLRFGVRIEITTPSLGEHIVLVPVYWAGSTVNENLKYLVVRPGPGVELIGDPNVYAENTPILLMFRLNTATTGVVAEILLNVGVRNSTGASGLLAIGPLYVIRYDPSLPTVSEAPWGGYVGLEVTASPAALEDAQSLIEVFIVDWVNGVVVAEWQFPKELLQAAVNDGKFLRLGIDGFPSVYHASLEPQRYPYPSYRLYEPYAGDYIVLVRGYPTAVPGGG